MIENIVARFFVNPQFTCHIMTYQEHLRTKIKKTQDMFRFWDSAPVPRFGRFASLTTHQGHRPIDLAVALTA